MKVIYSSKLNRLRCQCKLAHHPRFVDHEQIDKFMEEERTISMLINVGLPNAFLMCSDRHGHFDIRLKYDISKWSICDHSFRYYQHTYTIHRANYKKELEFRKQNSSSKKELTKSKEQI